MTKENAVEKSVERKYSKEQILKSERYAGKRDLLGAILRDNKQYGLKEVDNAIDNYMRKQVR